MSDKRAVEGAGPYDADGGFPANSEFRIPHSAFISRPYAADGLASPSGGGGSGV